MTPTTQVLISVATATLVALVAWSARWLVRGLRTLVPVVVEIRDFSRRWESAAQASATIFENGQRISKLETQLGTLDRQEGWGPIESYLHEWRHESRNDLAKVSLSVDALALATGLLNKCACSLAELTERLAELAERLPGAESR